MMAERFVRALLRYRVVLALVIGCMSIYFGYQCSKIRLVTSFSDLLPQKHEYVKVHNEFQKRFGGANVISVAVAVQEGTIFNEETLRKIQRIT